MARGAKKARWKLVAESYECDTCGAGPGDPCHNGNGKPVHMPHVPRTQLARQNGWLTAEEVEDGVDPPEYRM